MRIKTPDFNYWTAKFICVLLRLYQCSMSAWFGPACRFEPSCSHYAHEAISRHGTLKGLNLALRRILRCRPFCGFGYDPVPEKTKENSNV